MEANQGGPKKVWCGHRSSARGREPSGGLRVSEKAFSLMLRLILGLLLNPSTRVFLLTISPDGVFIMVLTIVVSNDY